MVNPTAPRRLEDEKEKEVDITEHLMPAADVAKMYETDLSNGLTEQQVSQKIMRFGLNQLTPPPTMSNWKLFVKNLTGFFSILLWIASFLCFVAYFLDPKIRENLYLGMVLAFVVLVTGWFSYYQDAKSAAVMEGFKNFLPPETVVVRGGKDLKVQSINLVPGDLVHVKFGEKLPADIRIITASNLKVDNASLTGEALPQKRGPDNHEQAALEATNMMYYGTLCVEGQATGIVIRTGDRTVIGKIAHLASTTETTETPIAIEIHHFIYIISGVAIFLGVSFGLIGIIKGTGVIDNVVFCIGIIVANVPEGLLATVTVSLTLTAVRMSKKHVLVKNLESVETLGSTSVIASDKTGTLTQNRMTVAHVWYNGQTYIAHGDGASSFKDNDPTFRRLQLVASLCNNAVFLEDAKNMALPVVQRQCKGDASETAFIKFLEPLESVSTIRDAFPKIGEVPFNSANKFQVTIHRQPEGLGNGGDRLLCMKGAPERIWERCSHVLVNGQLVPTASMQAQYEETLRSMMGNGERVLACCYRELPAADFPDGYEYEMGDDGEFNFPMDGMVFAGVLALIDPPRAAVPRAVRLCQSAGIRVIMVTGDHPDTAEAIARQVGIIRGRTRRDVANKRGLSMQDVARFDPEVEALVVTGSELAEMSDLDLQDVLEYDQVVFARTSPKQKLIIVKGLQAKTIQRRGFPPHRPRRVRHVVAVTGDGVNDSPALKAADIGVAMGIEGSDVAKDAADMILLNDNFASIVDGVEEGRLIFENLKKSIAYTLSSNIPEITPFLSNILFQLAMPLSVVLILCIDLGTDMAPAISFAYENKESNLMQKPPRDMLTDRLVTAKLISFSYVQIGMVQAAAGFFTYFVVMLNYGFAPREMFFTEQVFYKHNYESDLYSCQAPGQPIVSSCDPRSQKWPAGTRFCFGSEGLCVTSQECQIEDDAVCRQPNEALMHAQSAFFVSIVIVQYADLFACKTRLLPLFNQGIHRNMILVYSWIFEHLLAMALVYMPIFNTAISTRPIHMVHWFTALPFLMWISWYDEIRKYLMRELGEDSWLYRFTYY